MSGCGAFTVFMNVIPALLQYHLHFSVSGLILLPQIRMQTLRKKKRARTDLHKLDVHIPLSFRPALFDRLLISIPFSFLSNISTVQDLRQPVTTVTLLCCFFYRP